MPALLFQKLDFRDRLLFCGQKEAGQFLADKIDRTHTTLGKSMLYYTLVQPVSSKAVLKKRQALIQELVENEELFNAIEGILQNFKKSESMFVSFWTNDPFKNAVQKRFFNYSSKGLSDRLNKMPLLLSARTLFGHQERTFGVAATAIAALVLPVYGISQLMGWAMPTPVQNLASNLQSSGGSLWGLLSSLYENKVLLGTLAIGSGICCGLQLKESAEWMSDNFALDGFIHTKMTHVVNVVESLKKISALLDCNPAVKNALEYGLHVHILCADQSSDFQLLCNCLKNPIFKQESSLLRNKGEVLTTYKLFYNNKQKFEDALIALGELDLYMSLAKLYKEHVNLPTKYCFAEYIERTEPSLHLQQFWNPFIDIRKVVCNSVELGSSDSRRNMIITGPNAGGKSTMLKAIAFTLLMAQSFGIAPAQAVTLTPFDNIMTYLNVVDDIGAGNSLFKAQVLRTQAILDKVHDMPSTQKSFVIIDEMFNGTSPQEAQACAYSVAKALDAYNNNLTIIATHYDLLTSLETTSNKYANYHVSVSKTPEGLLKYPFLLERGISSQHVALDILRNEGFEGSIVQDAQRIIDQQNKDKKACS